MLLFAADGPLGDGKIDNTIIEPWVHRTSGIVVLVTMALAALYLTRVARAGRPLDRTARILLAVAQLSLMVQALLGIKLLDQGMGIVQLYIHYVGGLLPLGLFLGAGWVAFRRPARRTKVLAVLTWLGLLSATMAFFIGRAYVDSQLG